MPHNTLLAIGAAMIEFSADWGLALVPACATTIHKSQGSEYPAVVIPVLTQHDAMLQRNLLYTGVTRGKHVVVLRRPVAIAVKDASGGRRRVKLVADVYV